MVDRIERYLGRLEAELEGRVDGVRLSEILDEVEGHLRESEEGWRELGEPDALANRLAVEGFGGIAELSLQVRDTTHFGGRPHEIWNYIGWLSSFTLMVGLVVVSALISSMVATFWIVIFPAVLLVISSFIRSNDAWRRTLLGGATAMICLLVLFLSVGRASFSGGWPILGLNIGNSAAIARGQIQSDGLARRELSDAETMLADSERHFSVAKESIKLFPFMHPERSKKWLLIGVSDSGYRYSYTDDHAAAYQSWLKDGRQFIEIMQTNVVKARERLEIAKQFSNADLGQRILPILASLGLLFCFGSLILVVSVGLGVLLRRIVGMIEKVMKKVVRYGVQK